MLVHKNCQFVMKEAIRVAEEQDGWQTLLCFMAWSIV